MSENLLKGGQTTPAFEPLASERVPQLMSVEALDTAQPTNRVIELSQ